MLRNAIFGVCIAAMLASSAQAGPLAGSGLDSDDMAWFYNRVGATLADLETDLAACRNFGSMMTAPNPNAAFSGLVTLGANAATQSGPRAAYADDCMIARGWQRYSVQDGNLAAFNARFAAMSETQKLALISGEGPSEGQLARAWANDYWIASEGDSAVDASRPAVQPSVMPGLLQGQVIRPLNRGASIVVGPQDAVVVLTAAAEGERSAVVGFRRSEMPPIGRDGRQRVLQFDIRAQNGVRSELIFIIPSGTYALAIGGWVTAWNSAFTDFCLGTAAFTAQAGQILYLGDVSINMNERVITPTSPAAQFGLRVDSGDLEQGRAILSRAPDLAAQLERAEFRNGVVHPCQPFVGRIYGFDIPGAPYASADAK